MTKIRYRIVLALLLSQIAGCAGGLRYHEIAPEAKDFRPRKVAVLPADTKAFPQAAETIDRLFAEALRERGWFAVVGGEEVGRRMNAEGELRQAVADYLGKRDKVNFSDPVQSGRIGALTDAEAFVLVRVDYWNYTTEKDDKLGKVSLSVTMIEARTGKTLWAAAHQKASVYVIMKPELLDVARGLIREMIDHMPH